MPAKAIVITGTPGTGKTTIAQLLQNEGIKTFNLQKFAEDNDCIDGFDDNRQSKIVDIECLEKSITVFLDKVEGPILFEGHFGDVVPKKDLIACYVLQTNLQTLKKRLEERNYSLKKIEENMQAEIMQECWIDALDAYGPNKVTKIIDQTKEVIKQEIMNRIANSQR